MISMSDSWTQTRYTPPSRRSFTNDVLDILVRSPVVAFDMPNNVLASPVVMLLCKMTSRTRHVLLDSGSHTPIRWKQNLDEIVMSPPL
jgi:hypothetical protein